MTLLQLTLTRIGWIHSFEYLIPEKLTLDNAQTETKTAIEVDGPMGSNNQRIDQTKLKSHVYFKIWIG